MQNTFTGHFGNNRRGFLQTLLSFLYIFFFYGGEHILGMTFHLRAETPVADTAFLVLPVAFDLGGETSSNHGYAAFAHRAENGCGAVPGGTGTAVHGKIQ